VDVAAIDIGLLSIIVLGAMLFLLLTGMPAAFVLLALSAVGFWVLRGPAGTSVLGLSLFSMITKDIFIALPTFIFMAALLEISGLGSVMYETMYKWFAGLRGGLAMGTILIGMFLAARSGSAATATLTMGLLAYPEMAKRGYDKRLMVGTIPASGSLGPLIPPSVPMILVAAILNASIGKLFMAGIIPGILTGLGYMLYIGIRCWRNPAMGPSIPVQERANMREKVLALRAAIMPMGLIFLVLGLIYLGIATPSEAGGVGAMGALACAAIYRNLTLQNLKRATQTSVKLTAMLMWLLATGSMFSALLGVMGVQAYTQTTILNLQLGPDTTVLFIMVLVLIMGMFIDATPITVIFLPIFYPIVSQLGFDMVWFGLMFTMAIIVGIMTPPFGMVLFYFKGLNLPGVTMGDIFRAIVPFFSIMIVVLVLVFFVPSLATWLPEHMIR
jgi:tripartite ATP-independent transporter DctM subunit